MTATEHVEQMKRMSEILVDYSFPTVSPTDEETIAILKQRIVVVDGYEVTLYYSKCRYKDNLILKTAQIYSRTMTYLPFRLLCKIAKLFFGDEEPGFVELSDKNFLGRSESRQVYVWTVYCNENGLIPFKENPVFSDLTRCKFENFVYHRINQKNSGLTFF